MNRFFFFFISCIGFLSCSTSKRVFQKPVTGLRFIGEYSLPHKTIVGGTTLGGLSGIDYVPAEDLYYLICDDRSDLAPARFYTAKIFISARGIDSIGMTGVTTLLQKNGKPYPNRKIDSLHVPDPEALRVNRQKGTFVWSSEGERIVRKGFAILNDPAVQVVGKNGQLTDTFPLPANVRIKGTENGLRQNGGFEGLAFSPDFKNLYVSIEEPLYEDGPRAGLFDSSAWTRILHYDTESKLLLAQYAYQIDPVVQEPFLEGLFKVNGVTDILAINAHQLLVTERSFSTGRLGCNIRVYIAELDGAENVATIASLHHNPPQQALQKKLLLNMDNLGRLVDNVEGATWGPLLPNGKRSLLFVADDNFSPLQKNQFLLFEVQD